jgi:hypothetical protein
MVGPAQREDPCEGASAESRSGPLPHRRPGRKSQGAEQNPATTHPEHPDTGQGVSREQATEDHPPHPRALPAEPSRQPAQPERPRRPGPAMNLTVPHIDLPSGRPGSKAPDATTG